MVDLADELGERGIAGVADDRDLDRRVHRAIERAEQVREHGGVVGEHRCERGEPSTRGVARSCASPVSALNRSNAFAASEFSDGVALSW